ncbi:endonuclease domain-containing protein [Corynebacterium mayonis]|uniref:endonuclease domain-containing protein n=1 Tax=Corynebacterium mayonis TaxID=3062461 RepID=UPI00313FEB72
MRSSPHAPEHLPMGDHLAFPRSVWEELARHEQQLVRVVAAGLSSRGAVLVGRSAARLHGMWLIGAPDNKVELSLPSRGISPSRRQSGKFVFRHFTLPTWQVIEISGIRATSAIRAFVDIARCHGFVEGLVAIDWLRFQGVERESIAREIKSMGRFKGIAVVRRCFEMSIATSESPYESYARGLLIEASIAGIKAQVKIEGYRVDLLIDDWLVVEIDGGIKYRSADAEKVRQKEYERQKQIANQGYVFLRYSPAQLLSDPEAFVREVRSALGRGRPFG